MGLFDWFSSGPKAAEKVLDAGVRGLDALVFTDEERAELNKKLGELWVRTQEVISQESSIRSVTRRFLAFLVTIPYVALILSAAVAFYFNPEYAKFLLQLADSKFGWLVVAVAGFYFGPHMIGRFLQKKGD